MNDGPGRPACRRPPTSRRRRRRPIAPAGPRRIGPPVQPGSTASGPGSRRAGIDAYFGMRREHMRYLTGFTLADGEEKVAGTSGQFLVGGGRGRPARGLALHDPGASARRRTRGSSTARATSPRRWPGLAGVDRARSGSASRRRLVPYAVWRRLEAAAPDVELVPVEGWIEADRAIKEPAELERVAAAVRGRGPGARGAAAVDPAGRDGATSSRWTSSGGCGPAAPRRSPSSRPASSARTRRCRTARRPTRPSGPAQVVLFDFGAEVDGYRSDMTRTLFVGEPAERDLAVYELVAKAQAAVIAPDRGDRRRRAGAAVGARAPRPRPADDRGRRALAGVRARARPRDRPRDPRAAVARSARR